MAKNGQFYPTMKLDYLHGTFAYVWVLCDYLRNCNTFLEHFECLFCQKCPKSPKIDNVLGKITILLLFWSISEC